MFPRIRRQGDHPDRWREMMIIRLDHVPRRRQGAQSPRRRADANTQALGHRRRRQRLHRLAENAHNGEALGQCFGAVRGVSAVRGPRSEVLGPEIRAVIFFEHGMVIIL